MWGYLAVGVVVILGIGAILGLRNFYGKLFARYESEVYAMASALQLSQIPGLVDECVMGFRAALGKELNPDDLEGGAATFSEVLNDVRKSREAFAKDGVFFYYVLPTGAFLGEMLCRHAGGVWELSDDGGPPRVRIATPSGEAVCWPFDKILKHRVYGTSGDLYAYIASSINIEQAMSERLGDAS